MRALLLILGVAIACAIGAAAIVTLIGGGDKGLPRRPYDFSARPVRPVPDGAPNVLFVSTDSLRPDHLRCYGYERETSPEIDRLAREGALFETAVSTTTWTLPSHLSMFTSLYDSLHGVTTSRQRYVIEHPLLAEVLQAAG